jgi:hypothetical protein
VAKVVQVGAVAGIAGGTMMAMYQMIVAAIAQNPTAVPGIHQTFWTPVTGISSVVFGKAWFHGSFDVGSVLLGLGGHMMNSMILGVVGVGILTAVLGRRPSLGAAVMVGVAFGVAIEAILINGIINGAQSIHTLYDSTPHWSWWVAHGIFGMTLGGLAALMLRRGTQA